MWALTYRSSACLTSTTTFYNYTISLTKDTQHSFNVNHIYIDFYSKNSDPTEEFAFFADYIIWCVVCIRCDDTPIALALSFSHSVLYNNLGTDATSKQQKTIVFIFFSLA
jgi:hypothetical protein